MSDQNSETLSEISKLYSQIRNLSDFLDDSTDQLDCYNIAFFAQKDFVERFQQSEPE